MKRSALEGLIITFVLLASIYSIIDPIFEASDEVAHFPVIKHYADGNGVPYVDGNSINDPMRQEAAQPPFYYMLGAALTFWIDTDDMPDVRWVNPHADVGFIPPDGNINSVVHDDVGFDALPWSGTRLAVHWVRFMSILMAAGTIYYAYRLAQELFPGHENVALLTAALVAFNPMFLFISASVNNDNLSNLIAAALLVQIVVLLKQDDLPTNRQYVVIGVLTGIGMLAKFQIGFLTIFIALTLAIISYRHRRWQPLVMGGLIAGGLTIAIAGWWYWRNYDLYGDPTGIEPFLDVAGRRLTTPNLDQLWSERNSFIRTFWGLFGGINVPLESTYYTVFNGLAAVGIIGLLIRVVTHGVEWSRLTLVRVLAAIWIVVVVAALIRWTSLTPASQGRLMFAALAPIMLGIAVGWYEIGQRLRVRYMAILPLLYFVVVATVIAPITIYEAYDPPPELDSLPDTFEIGFAEPTSDQVQIKAHLNELPETVRTGQYLEFSVDMLLDASVTRNWSIFIHLVNETGIIEAQRDVYPGQGLLRTASLEAGRNWRNHVAILIPEGIYAPQELTVYMGLYDLKTGERMIPQGQLPTDDSRRVALGNVTLAARDGDVPNPVNVNFDNQLMLRGYQIDNRALEPGDTATATFFWEAVGDLDRDYVISVQIIDLETARKAAQVDAPPTDLPTSQWPTDNVREDTRQLTIAPDTPPGTYRVMVRVYYTDIEGNLTLLPIAGGEGQREQDFFYLNWVRVLEP